MVSRIWQNAGNGLPHTPTRVRCASDIRCQGQDLQFPEISEIPKSISSVEGEKPMAEEPAPANQKSPPVKFTRGNPPPGSTPDEPFIKPPTREQLMGPGRPVLSPTAGLGTP